MRRKGTKFENSFQHKQPRIWYVVEAQTSIQQALVSIILLKGCHPHWGFFMEYKCFYKSLRVVREGAWCFSRKNQNLHLQIDVSVAFRLLSELLSPAFQVCHDSLLPTSSPAIYLYIPYNSGHISIESNDAKLPCCSLNNLLSFLPPCLCSCCSFWLDYTSNFVHLVTPYSSFKCPLFQEAFLISSERIRGFLSWVLVTLCPSSM